MDAKQLEEAITTWEPDANARGYESLQLLVEAAKEHLATLPDPDTHAIVGVRRSTGEAFVFKSLGTYLMSAGEAEGRAKQWRKDYPDVAYTVVKLEV